MKHHTVNLSLSDNSHNYTKPHGALLFSLFFLFWKNESSITEPFCVLCPYAYLPYKLVNTWRDLYGTFCIDLGNKTHFIGVYHKPLLPLLGNGSVNTFPWQGRTVGGVVFYAVRIVSKGNKQLVLRTSCIIYCNQKYRCSRRQIIGWMINVELENIWKRNNFTKIEIPSQQLPGTMEKNH
jgi:hypothetical protein